MRAIVAGLALLGVGVPAAAARAAESMRIEFVKVPGTTAAVARIEGELDAAAPDVQRVLCDLEGHPRFSPNTERVAVLSPEDARALEASPPGRRAAIEARVVPGRLPAACPGRTWVLNLLDFPFPLPDGWSMAVYDASVSDATFRLSFDTIVGTGRGAGEYVVTALAPTRSRLAVRYDIDLGVPLPRFLMDLAGRKQFPRMFAEIEQQARRLSPH